MGIEDHIAELELFAKTFDPSARIIIKDDSWFMKFLFVFVKFFNKRFMTSFATTICNRVYIPREWIEVKCDLRRLLVHEVAGHVRQCRKCGLGLNPWVGFPIYMILYTITFFPVYLAYFRYRFELDAEMEAFKWCLKNGYRVEEIVERSNDFAKTVASWDYLKPWPSSLVLKGFSKNTDNIVNELVL